MSLSSHGIQDPRSGIQRKPISDSGSRGQEGTGSRIRIRNTDGRVYTVSAIMVGGEKFFEGKERDQIIHLAINVKKIFLNISHIK